MKRLEEVSLLFNICSFPTTQGTNKLILVFYYNIKTHESRWKPPTVKVHEQRKIADRTSVKGEALFQPHPPEAPKNNGNNGGAEDSEADRVKKAS